MYDVFLAYKSDEQEYAEKVAEALAKSGYKVWWAAHLFAGQNFYKDIYKVIDQVSAVVVIWSHGSVESDWVFNEAVYAEKQGKFVPVTIGAVEPPAHFQKYHNLDIKEWLENSESRSFDDLLQAIATKFDSDPPIPVTDEDIVSSNMQTGDFEAQYWAAINRDENQTVELYEHYQEKFQPSPVFAELAARKIDYLRKKKNRDWVFLAKKMRTVILLLAAMVAIAAGLIQILDWYHPTDSDIGRGVPIGVKPRANNDDKGEQVAVKSQTASQVDEKVKAREDENSDATAQEDPVPKIENRGANEKKAGETAAQKSESSHQIPINNSLPTLRVYAGTLDSKRIEDLLRPLGVRVVKRPRDACLSGTPATSIWPDQSVKFSDFKEIVTLLIDDGLKFYAIFPKRRPAHNTIDVGSIVSADTCTLKFEDTPFSRTEVLAAQHFCAGYRPLTRPPPDKSWDWVTTHCFSR